MSEKIIGYLLVITGILIILFSVLNIYRVFTKKTQPIQFFNYDGISIHTGSIISKNMENLPKEYSELNLKQQTKSEPAEIISPKLINDTTNLVAHFVLMGFVLNAGYKLASIGTMLVRPVVVKLKTKEENQSNSQTKS